MTICLTAHTLLPCNNSFPDASWDFQVVLIQLDVLHLLICLSLVCLQTTHPDKIIGSFMSVVFLWVVCMFGVNGARLCCRTTRSSLCCSLEVFRFDYVKGNLFHWTVFMLFSQLSEVSALMPLCQLPVDDTLMLIQSLICKEKDGDVIDRKVSQHQCFVKSCAWLLSDTVNEITSLCLTQMNCKWCVEITIVW